jgi:alanine dehydrogenase
VVIGAVLVPGAARTQIHQSAARRHTAIRAETGNLGLEATLADDTGLAGGLSTHAGTITHDGVAAVLA